MLLNADWMCENMKIFSSRFYWSYTFLSHLYLCMILMCSSIPLMCGSYWWLIKILGHIINFAKYHKVVGIILDSWGVPRLGYGKKFSPFCCIGIRDIWQKKSCDPFIQRPRINFPTITLQILIMPLKQENVHNMLITAV